jgi:hypothetical protein
MSPVPTQGTARMAPSGHWVYEPELCFRISIFSLHEEEIVAVISAIISGDYNLTNSQRPELLFYRRCITVQENHLRNHCYGVSRSLLLPWRLLSMSQMLTYQKNWEFSARLP